MKQINIREQDPSVQKFLESLAAAAEDTQVQQDGRTVLRILAHNLLSAAEKEAVIERRRELMRRARERAKGMSAEEIERFVDEAIDEVRKRPS